MIYKNALKKTLCIVSTGVASSMLLSTTVLAHTGHSHSQHDTLSGILHTLTTHPLLFGAVGLLILSAILIRR